MTNSLKSFTLGCKNSLTACKRQILAISRLWLIWACLRLTSRQSTQTKDGLMLIKFSNPETTIQVQGLLPLIAIRGLRPNKHTMFQAWLLSVTTSILRRLKKPVGRSNFRFNISVRCLVTCKKVMTRLVWPLEAALRQSNPWQNALTLYLITSTSKRLSLQRKAQDKTRCIDEDPFVWKVIKYICLSM